MRTLSAVVAGAVVGASVLVGGRALASFPQDADAKSPGCLVAVVDVSKAIQAHPRLKAIEEKLNRDADDLRDRLNKEVQELRKVSQEVEARLTPGTTAYETERKKLAIRNAEIQYDEKAGQELLVRRAVVAMAQVYREICQEAERIASERGYSCVLNVESEPLVVEDKGQVMSRNDLRMAMRTRSTIWAREGVDLTQAVIDALVSAAAAEGPEPGKDGEKK